MKFLSAILICITLLAGLRTMSAEPAHPSVDFSRDVYPILQRHCIECHGPEKQNGKLRLDSRAAATEGGTNGAAIIAGKAAESELIRRVLLTKADDEVMPARGELLSKKQIETLRQWIDEGAVWPEKVKASSHWAYVPPKRPAVPAIRDAKLVVRNPIDAFIISRLEALNMRPTPEAERAVLLRRVSLDLIGLPPSPKELDDFLADTRPDAYKRAVTDCCSRRSLARNGRVCGSIWPIMPIRTASIATICAISGRIAIG
jgi:mono/diheme cytochrome c family protein